MKTPSNPNFIESLVQPDRRQNANTALQEAASKGWNDIAEGRYVDIADDQIENFLARLGRQAARRGE